MKQLIRSLNRRTFLQTGAAALGGSLIATALPVRASARKPLMTMDLAPSRIGVEAAFPEVIELAHRYGFGSVAPNASYLATLSDADLESLLADLEEKNLVFGAGNLSVDFRGEDALFQQGLADLPAEVATLQKAGVTRLGTWIMPGHATLTYEENFAQHARRLREIATVLKDHDVRLGLEYVGTPSLRASQANPFVYNMAQTKELIQEIGTGNVGFVVDSWHWHMAGETEADLLTLQNEDVVAADLNDAPASIPDEEQQDGTRELPLATGVIDDAAFLNALQQISYDGPVRAEPFSSTLNNLPDEEAVAATAEAMKKAFALIQS